jgi:hypothetical protein
MRNLVAARANEGWAGDATTMPMSAEECRAHAETCERMAESLGPENSQLRDVMREVADQWRRLASDAEARERNNSNRPTTGTGSKLTDNLR